MSPQRRLVFALCAIFIFVSPHPVRGQDLSGSWSAEIPVRIGGGPGGETVEQTASVTLSLTQEGETVHATWQMAPLPDRPAPEPRTLHGVLRGGQLVLTDTTEAMVRRGDEPPTPVTMINTIELTLEGDRLTGYQSARSDDGMITGQRRPFTATRVRS